MDSIKIIPDTTQPTLPKMDNLTQEQRAQIIRVFTSDEGVAARESSDCLLDATAWFALGIIAAVKSKDLIEILRKNKVDNLIDWADEIISNLNDDALEYAEDAD